jgi:hypothetical protein
LAVTDAFDVRVNVQVFVLFPPLEHAPDQMTSRSFVALSVIDVPMANDAEPLTLAETSLARVRVVPASLSRHRRWT